MVASLNLQRIERAPRAAELFAKGPHDATQTFDIGNPNLTIETASTAEIGLKRVLGDFRFDGKAYYTRFNNFIYQQPTGIYCGEEFATCGVETELLQTVIAQRDAIFWGGELAWQWDVVPVGPGVFGLDGQYDTVRATFTDGSNVPRIPPQRLGGGAYWRSDNWFVRAGLLHAFAQYDLAPFETPTAGYNLVKAEIINKQYWRDSPWGPVELTTGLVGNNLLDVDIRNSTQFHKDEVLLPGRSVKLYLNAKFDAIGPSGAPGSLKGHKGPLPAMTVTKAPIMAAWGWQGLYVGGQAGLEGRPRRHQPQLRRSARRRPEPLFGGQAPKPVRRRDLRRAGRLQLGATGCWWPASRATSRGRAAAPKARRSARATSATRGWRRSMRRLPRRSITGLPWFGTLRGRLGTRDHAASPAVRDGRRGVRRGQDQRYAFGLRCDRQPATMPSFSHNVAKGGWTVGGGFEAHLGRQLDRQGRISLHGLRLPLDRAGSDTGRHRRDDDQPAAHHQHRARRHQLQTELTAQTAARYILTLVMPGLLGRASEVWLAHLDRDLAANDVDGRAQVLAWRTGRRIRDVAQLLDDDVLGGRHHPHLRVLRAIGRRASRP